MKPEAYQLLAFAASHLTKASDEERDVKIVTETQNQALASDAPLRTIVANLAEFAFRNFKMLPHEFIESFKRNRSNDQGETGSSYDLSDILVEGFVNKLIGESIKHNRTPEHLADQELSVYQGARQRLFNFLQQYKEIDLITLSEFVESQRHYFPGVEFSRFFTHDVEIKTLLIQKIREAAPKAISEKYQALYRENPHNFVLSFLLRRVITYQNGRFLSVNKKNLRAIIEFLAERKDPPYQLEDLYLLLFTYLSEMRQILSIQKDVRDDIQSTAPGMLNVRKDDEDAGIFQEDFNFHEFFRDHFKTPIKDIRNASLKVKPRSIDLQVKGMNYLIAPERSMTPFTEMADFIADPALFNARIRSFFGYTSTEGEMGLDDIELEKVISRQLGFAAKQIAYTLKNGLKMRSKDDPIHQDFNFLEPIISCCDIKQLARWFAYPDNFFAEYPDFQDKVSHTAVRFQARRMLECFILYREHSFSVDFKHRYQKRDLLEQHLRERLQIHDEKIISQAFRILLEIDPETGLPLKGVNGNGGGSHHDVIFPYSNEWPQSDISDHEEAVIVKNDKHYKAMPVEQKQFLEVEMNIPTAFGALRPMKILFYTDDNHILAVKSLHSYLSSYIRGKVPSDMVRCMMVLPSRTSKEDTDALIDVIYEYSTHVVKIDHSTEKRTISKKGGQPKRAESTATFESHRMMSNAAYAILPRAMPHEESDALTDKELEQLDASQHSKVAFETQVMDMASMCIAASDHTDTSHHMSYAPEREFNTACLTFFPPIIYGQKFAKYYLQGYRGDKSV